VRGRFLVCKEAYFGQWGRLKKKKSHDWGAPGPKLKKLEDRQRTNFAPHWNRPVPAGHEEALVDNRVFINANVQMITIPGNH